MFERLLLSNDKQSVLDVAKGERLLVDDKEIRSCAASAFKHWTAGTITLRKNNPGGAMRFPKIDGLE